MSAGGCRMLMFGLESGVARVLDYMNKGITPQVAARILRDCADVGIRSFVMFFVGFPTETREEAERTIAFVDELHDKIAHAAFTQFVLDRHAPVFGDPARYGLTEVQPFPDEDLKTWSQYRVTEGLTASEAGTVVAEIRRNPRIRPVDRPYLLSRSHLAFLPAVDGEASRATERPAARAASQRGAVVPLRRPGLVPRVLAFNLDEVNERIAGGTTDALSRRPTCYVFSGERETLVETGPDGTDILRACNGMFTIDEILTAVGPGNREATLRFLEELEARDYIEWSQPA
jgi:hypothetical protein